MYQVNTKQKKAGVAKLMQNHSSMAPHKHHTKQRQSTEQEQLVRQNQNATLLLDRSIRQYFQFCPGPMALLLTPKSPSVTLNNKSSFVSVPHKKEPSELNLELNLSSVSQHQIQVDLPPLGQGMCSVSFSPHPPQLANFDFRPVWG